VAWREAGDAEGATWNDTLEDMDPQCVAQEAALIDFMPSSLRTLQFLIVATWRPVLLITKLGFSKILEAQLGQLATSSTSFLVTETRLILLLSI
jgi:hypothetical protein